ncbi:MAG TPA: GNAT family N-acetyltransferase [Pyrinomonadaceae bacterium]|nr:GNAT family N-acetyltransferase [Pyrinomonadaceae bacterium]
MTGSRFEIRRLSDCSLTDAVEIWNEGFKGYFVDMTLTADDYLKRLRNEDLSHEHSLIAFSDDKPAGFLLNGIRATGGLKVAWNGGTGVSAEFRKQGVGKALVQAAIDVYAAEKVELATLEALSNNTAAIALYRKFGYELLDRLIFLRHEGRLEDLAHDRETSPYSARSVHPAEVGPLSFYRQVAPWQTQWQSLQLNDGQAVIVSDAAGVDVGYALFRKKFAEAGKLEGIALSQCEVSPDRPDSAAIAVSTLSHVYSPLDQDCRRSTSNLRMSNELVLKILRTSGFTTFVEQLHMAKRLSC